MSTDKLGTFCTIFNASNWNQYQAEVNELLLTSSSPDEARVDFPASPKSYPCLVAATPKVSDPTKANDFSYFRVECCFVYLNDAHRLLDAAASVSDSIIVEDEGGLPPGVEEFMGSPLEAAAAGSPEEADLTILVLGMLKELDAIGAIKFDRLMGELPEVQKALESYSQRVEQPESMIDFLKQLWGELNAG